MKRRWFTSLLKAHKRKRYGIRYELVGGAPGRSAWMKNEDFTTMRFEDRAKAEAEAKKLNEREKSNLSRYSVRELD